MCILTTRTSPKETLPLWSHRKIQAKFGWVFTIYLLCLCRNIYTKHTRYKFPLGLVYSSEILNQVGNHIKHIFQMPHVRLMTTYQRVITPNAVLNGCRCHFPWYWPAVLPAALRLDQQVGSTVPSPSPCVHGCIDWVWLLGSGANSGSTEGQACCPIKQRDLQTGSGQYPSNRPPSPSTPFPSGPWEHPPGGDWDCRAPFSFHQRPFICSYNLAQMN